MAPACCPANPNRDGAASLMIRRAVSHSSCSLYQPLTAMCPISVVHTHTLEPPCMPATAPLAASPLALALPSRCNVANSGLLVAVVPRVLVPVQATLPRGFVVDHWCAVADLLKLDRRHHRRGLVQRFPLEVGNLGNPVANEGAVWVGLLGLGDGVEDAEVGLRVGTGR